MYILGHRDLNTEYPFLVTWLQEACPSARPR